MTLASQQVSWWSVREFVAHRLTGLKDIPRAGTPAWCELNDDDPIKLAAVLVDGMQWALRIDTEQSVRAQASHDVSAAVDCRALARRVRNGRGSAYIERKKVS